MKEVTLFILLFVFGQFLAFGQICIAANNSLNIIYANWQNSIDVVVEGKYCKQLLVKTDNGAISATDACRYIITPLRTGFANVFVSDKKTKKLLCKTLLRVEKIPEPQALVAGMHGGQIKKNLLEVQVGVLVQNDMFRSRSVVSGYVISIIRDASIVFTKRCKSAFFDDEIKGRLGLIETGDRVIFSDISYKGVSITGHIQPIEFKIIE